MNKNTQKLITFFNSQSFKDTFQVEYTNQNIILIQLLYSEGLIQSYENLDKKQIKITVNNVFNKKKFLTAFKNKKYKFGLSFKQVTRLNNKEGLLIISTNKGLKVLEDVKRLKLGGIPLYKVN